VLMWTEITMKSGADAPLLCQRPLICQISDICYSPVGNGGLLRYEHARVLCIFKGSEVMELSSSIFKDLGSP